MMDRADGSDKVILPPEHTANGAYITDMDEYKTMYEESVTDPEGFWAKQARNLLHWDHDFNQVLSGGFAEGDITWFNGGKLNACVQCLDRHIAAGNGDNVAIVYEGDEPGESRSYTFNEALRQVCRIANVMLKYGVKKGDPVSIYMGMIPESLFVMLACARIGAPHSVVFAGFSVDALRERIADVRSKFVFTCNEGLRGGRRIKLKNFVDSSIEDLKFVEHVFVFKRTPTMVEMKLERDVAIEEEIVGMRPYCPPVSMDAEDPFFFLYTSGSTGKPKGVMHTTAGYMLFTTITHKLVFDYRPGDVYACVADFGWITGHSYIVYGPLSNGATTLIFESTPLYPDPGRYWDLISRHKITQFYTAPTAIRALMSHGSKYPESYDLSSLRVLGTVGEPMNPSAWEWYFEHVGSKRCSIVDTYWQTETGGHIVTSLPGATPMKPGSATLPFFGIQLELLDPQTGKVLPPKTGEEQSGVLCVKYPWPGITRTVYRNHDRYMNAYLRPYPGYYFTGDGCTRDKDGYMWITGRVDDVLNVSGHRIGSAEVENALVAYSCVSEAAVIGFPHHIKGEGIACYVVLKVGVTETDDLVKELRSQVRQVIGAFATPDHIIIVSNLPKTRSGKIMRRIMRKILSKEVDQLGDTSTLADPGVIDELILKVNKAMSK